MCLLFIDIFHASLDDWNEGKCNWGVRNAIKYTLQEAVEREESKMWHPWDLTSFLSPFKSCKFTPLADHDAWIGRCKDITRVLM